MSLEASEGLLEEMGTQALAKGSYSPPEEICKGIDNVALTDISNVRHFVPISAFLLILIGKWSVAQNVLQISQVFVRNPF